jgi:hypothetical protein
MVLEPAVALSAPSPALSVRIEGVLEKLPIPIWQMSGRISVIPQTWDADTPQVVTQTAADDPNMEVTVFVEEEPKGVPTAELATIELEQQAEERRAPPSKRPASQDGPGSLIVRIKTRVSTPTVIPAPTVHSAEACAPNGDGLPIVQAEVPQEPPV